MNLFTLRLLTASQLGVARAPAMPPTLWQCASGADFTGRAYLLRAFTTFKTKPYPIPTIYRPNRQPYPNHNHIATLNLTLNVNVRSSSNPDPKSLTKTSRTVGRRRVLLGCRRRRSRDRVVRRHSSAVVGGCRLWSGERATQSVGSSAKREVRCDPDVASIYSHLSACFARKCRPGVAFTRQLRLREALLGYRLRFFRRRRWIFAVAA